MVPAAGSVLIIQNFTTTRHLIDALEALCSSADAVERMRAHSATDELRRQWQLPVYFQLRWKEIVGRLEQKLAMASTAQTPVQGQRQVTGASVEEQEQDWVLPQSPAVWEAVQACWDDKVYLPELGGRFLRLTLQVSYILSSRRVCAEWGANVDAVDPVTV